MVIKRLNKFAFTLAEVLITLTILGVVAAITIPSLIQKQSDRATVSSAKKTYSTVANALDMAIAENGIVYKWDWPDKTSSNAEINRRYCTKLLSKHLNVSHDCTDNRNGACKTYDIRNVNNDLNYGGSNIFNYYLDAVILKDGVSLECSYLGDYFRHEENYRPYVTPWAAIDVRVDLNGQKGPNRRGFDVFYFPMSANGGLVTSNGDVKSYCNSQKPYSIANNNDGHSCILWILKHNNMNYKYRDVSSEW